MMDIFVILTAGLSVLAVLMNFVILSLYAAMIRYVKREQDNYMREFRKIFGFDSYHWSSEFSDLKRTVQESKEKLETINRLHVIREAIKLDKLEKATKQKDELDKEIERLNGNG